MVGPFSYDGAVRGTAARSSRTVDIGVGGAGRLEAPVDGKDRGSGIDDLVVAVDEPDVPVLAMGVTPSSIQYVGQVGAST